MELYFPLFLIPSILVVTICYEILSLFILAICPYHISLSDFKTLLSPCLFLFSRILLLLWDYKFIIIYSETLILAHISQI